MAFASAQAAFLRGSFSVSRKKCTIFITVLFFPLNVNFASVPRAAVGGVRLSAGSRCLLAMGSKEGMTE